MSQLWNFYDTKSQQIQPSTEKPQQPAMKKLNIWLNGILAIAIDKCIVLILKDLKEDRITPALTGKP